jgi:uncharacterized membrane protein YagU involved in acid resistance
VDSGALAGVLTGVLAGVLATGVELELCPRSATNHTSTKNASTASAI